MKKRDVTIIKLIAWLLGAILLTACLHREIARSDEVYSAKPVSLEGIVLNVPNNANLELALLALDEQNKPQELLAVERYKGNGKVQSVQLTFDINKAKQLKAVELRGRVSQAGVLKGYLSPWHKEEINSKELTGIILEFAN